MALDSGMEHEDKPRTLTYEETIKHTAGLYVEAAAESDSVQRQIRDLTNKIGDLERKAEKLRGDLAKTVGSNIPVRNILVGTKLVRVEHLGMERAPKVTVEDVGS